MMKRFRKCQKLKPFLERFLRSNEGTTLVELIVTFALLGIFFTAAAGVFLSSMRLFDRIQSTSNAVTVSDLVLDKISGEIMAAEIPPYEKEGYYCWISENGDFTNGQLNPNSGSEWIVFNNRSGSPMKIYSAMSTEDNPVRQVYIKYYEMSTGTSDASGAIQTIQEIDWHFDSRVYMGFYVEDLRFSRPDPENHPNVVRIDLTLHNTRTGFTYHTYRFARNYNYDTASDYMCCRADVPAENGNMDAPTTASEFKIKVTGTGGGDGGGETPPETDSYMVYYVSSRTGAQIGSKSYDQKIGDTFRIQADDIAGYDMPNINNVEVTYTSDSTSYTFEYNPKQFTYTLICVKNTGPRMVYQTGNIYADELIDVTAPTAEGTSGEIHDFLYGFEPVQTQYTFTAIGNNYGGNQYLMYYNAKKVPYTVSYMCNDQPIKEPLTGEVDYGSWVVASAQYIEGYTAIDSGGYSESASIGSAHYDQSAGTMSFVIRYRSNAATGDHPFIPVGQTTQVSLGKYDSAVEASLHKLADEIKNFYNGSWKEIHSDSLTGYYRTFVYNQQTYVVAGWTNTTGSDGELNKTITDETGIPKSNIIMIKNGAISGDDNWLFLASMASFAGSDCVDLIGDPDDKNNKSNKITSINLTFTYGSDPEVTEKTELSEITFKIQGDYKSDVTITFK